jgi:exopolyphosphatase/guanosine-5'-triphosphate,3'-diphosphate pyrophosphatase
VAAIDVGSNATRLAWVQVSSTGRLLHHHQERFAVRLGADVFAQGEVSEAKHKALVEVFVGVRDQLRQADVRTYRAVATSAMRDAKNGPTVARSVFDHSGITLQIITGVQESKLSRAALLRSVGTAEPDTLLMDLGGGSLELERAGDGARRGRSLPIGSVRLLETLPTLQAELTPEQFTEARAQVRALLRQHLRAPKKAPTVVGTGGNLDALALLLPVSGSSLPMINLPELLPFAQALAAMPPAQRQKHYNLRPDRADLVVPAALIVLELAELFAVERFVVPGTGLRDALLHNLLVPSEPGRAVRRLLGHTNDVAATADKAAALCRELFNDLATVHKIWPSALQPLQSATYAWYFGALLDPRAAAKHAAYLLQEVDTMGLGSEARAVALYAVQAQDSAQTPDFAGPEADLPVARVLAGLLGVAIAMAPQGRRTSAIEVDLLHDPIVVSADLSAPLQEASLRPLAQALGRQLVVR